MRLSERPNPRASAARLVRSYTVVTSAWFGDDGVTAGALNQAASFPTLNSSEAAERDDGMLRGHGRSMGIASSEGAGEDAHN
jgi:hypothetical protein